MYRDYSCVLLEDCMSQPTPPHGLTGNNHDIALRLTEDLSCRGPHRIRHGIWIIEAGIELDIYATDLKPDDRSERRSVRGEPSVAGKNVITA
jgi:hypothetical protein